MFIRLVAIAGLFFSLLSSNATAMQIDSEENYMSVELLPLCSELGQVKVVYSNVSGKKLLIDPYYGDPALYDAHNHGVSLNNIDFKGFVQLWATKDGSKALDYYSVIMPGQSVEHIVNFNDHNPDIDKSKSYIVMGGGAFFAITEDGQRIMLRLESAFLNKNLEIGPDCWK
ncbi:hypothetical protein [Shewanella sedimentimangrovi]|uniref:Uncharacterized protein n=1 Tax=Shewanella sedimentimangrovi TaxID=2814293 RepID=A0ABX7R001_9GAMM|nr:hypothetical protein [Shewanella sedimentimangrovi]QSX36622.1 hypothetical protein JYB85_15245 [Shewanella sedimentimangrovi]